MTYSDDILMALADKELPADMAARVQAAIEADPDMAARYAIFVKSRAAMARLRRAPDAVPEALVAHVRRLGAEARAEETRSNVVSLCDWRRVPALPMSIAAAIALAAGLFVGMQTAQTPGGSQLAGLGQPGVTDALGQLPSGERKPLKGGGEMVVIGSFLTGDGALCREFEYDGPDGRTLVSVACREGKDWETRLTIAAQASDDGYAPASSLETLDAWLTATEASAVLSPEEEMAALQ
jgi:hypothetical protein